MQQFPRFRATIVMIDCDRTFESEDTQGQTHPLLNSSKYSERSWPTAYLSSQPAPETTALPDWEMAPAFPRMHLVSSHSAM